MKNLIRCVLIGVFAFQTSLSVAENSSTKDLSSGKNAKEQKLTQEEANRLMSRLKEIRKMDRSSLSPDQKKGLKNEVLVIKERLSKADKTVVVYLSTLAVIIILLIILL